jgi:hypothetical protein
MVPPATWNTAQLLPIILGRPLDPNSRFIILHGASQTGKTTRILDLCDQLAKSYPDIIAVQCGAGFACSRS